MLGGLSASAELLVLSLIPPLYAMAAQAFIDTCRQVQPVAFATPHGPIHTYIHTNVIYQWQRYLHIDHTCDYRRLLFRPSVTV